MKYCKPKITTLEDIDKGFNEYGIEIANSAPNNQGALGIIKDNY